MIWENVEYENFRTPVSKLGVGVFKLLKYGMPTFLQYCAENRLSYCDMNRVISKARIAHGKTGLKEIPCPPELRQKRLDCYTKTYRYSLKEAQNIVKDLDDKYHGGQPVPDVRDLDKLVGRVARGV